jgi:hypothetical protein
MIHLMVAIEILSNPIPERLERSVVQWATALHVHEHALLYARDLARGALTKAVHDFYRLNWIGDLDHRSPEFEALLRHAGDKAYALTVDADAAEAARWNSLGSCPQGSIGRNVWEFYQMANPGPSMSRLPNMIGYTCSPTMERPLWAKSKRLVFRIPLPGHPERCSDSSVCWLFLNPVSCRPP